MDYLFGSSFSFNQWSMLISWITYGLKAEHDFECKIDVEVQFFLSSNS